MSSVGVFIFIAAILFSVGLHEFGHFITAKRFGMKVHSFYVGFKPAIWSTRRGETEYGIGAIPLGGFVKIAGMNPFEDVAPEDRERVFKAKAPWQRAIVLAAGSFTHFVVAFLILLAILWLVGSPARDLPTTTVKAVEQTLDGAPAPAAAAGIRPGDEVVAVAGSPIEDWARVVDAIKARPGQRIALVVRRDGRLVTLSALLATHKPQGTERVGFLGVSPVEKRRPQSFPSAFTESARALGSGMKTSVVAFGHLFSPGSIQRILKIATGQVERRPEDPATIVGIGGQAGRLARSGDFRQLFLLIFGLNVFIGVANLFPLPPLDGGHLAVLGFEKLTRRDVDMRRLIPVSAAVIAAFMSLFVLLLYTDIVRPLPAIPG